MALQDFKFDSRMLDLSNRLCYKELVTDVDNLIKTRLTLKKPGISLKILILCRVKQRKL